MGMFSSKTTMTKLTDREAFEVFELGDQLYYFKPKLDSDTCIITAHGDHTLLANTNRFTVKSDTVLRFGIVENSEDRVDERFIFLKNCAFFQNYEVEPA